MVPAWGIGVDQTYVIPKPVSIRDESMAKHIPCSPHVKEESGSTRVDMDMVRTTRFVSIWRSTVAEPAPGARMIILLVVGRPNGPLACV
jgi:hypothetical protein